MRGIDHKLQPLALGVLIDDGIKVAEAMWNQRTGTPENVDTEFRDYFLKDPLRTLVQIPAEVAMFITGTKLIGAGVKYGGKVAQTGFSKLPVQTQMGILRNVNKITSPVSDTINKYFPQLQVNKIEKSIYNQGITINNKPIIGVVNKKLVFGTPKPETIPLNKIGLKKRIEGELSYGYGAERNLFYSDTALTHMENIGFINKLSKTRSQASQKLEYATQKSKGDIFVGKLGENVFKNVSDDQGKALLKFIEKEYKVGTIEEPHGSLATRVHIQPSLRKESGNVLRLGDLDIVVKRLAKESDEIFEQRVSRIIQDVKKVFPIGKGEKLKITDKIGDSRSLELKRKDAKSFNKIFEIVVKDSDEIKLGLNKNSPTHIMGYKIPTDSVKMIEYDIRTSTLNYQGLTQTKTINAFQEYIPTISKYAEKLGTKNISSIESVVGKVKGELDDLVLLDTKSKAMIYPVVGREEKDVVRRYWQGRQSELNQIGDGLIKDAKKTRDAAESFKKLYPEFDFTKAVSDKVSISFESSKTSSISFGSSKSSSLDKLVKSTIPASVKNPTYNDDMFKPTTYSVPTKSVSRSIVSRPVSIRSWIVKSSSKSLSKSSFSKSKSSSGKPVVTLIGKSLFPKTTQRSKKQNKIIVPFVTLNDALRTRRTSKRKDKKIFEFIGNSRSDNISGIFNRDEIIYGKKKIARINKSDRAFVKKLNSKKKNRKSLVDINLNF